MLGTVAELAESYATSWIDKVRIQVKSLLVAPSDVVALIRPFSSSPHVFSVYAIFYPRD